MELPIHGKGNAKTIYRYLRAAKVEMLPEPLREESLKVAAMRRRGGSSHTRRNPWGTLWQLKHHLWNEQTDSLPGKEGEGRTDSVRKSPGKELGRRARSKSHLSELSRSLRP